MALSFGPFTSSMLAVRKKPCRFGRGSQGKSKSREPFRDARARFTLTQCFLQLDFLARGQPSVELLAALPSQGLKHDSSHSFRVHPGHLSPGAYTHSRGQLENEVQYRAVLKRLYRSNGHAASTQVGDAGLLLEFSLFQSYSKICGMAEIPALFAQEQPFRNGDVHSRALFGQRLAQQEVGAHGKNLRGFLRIDKAGKNHRLAV